MEPNVTLTVDVCLFGGVEHEPHVLLVQTNKPAFEGKWALPGGKVESDERVLDAAYRELHEETGAARDATETLALRQLGVYDSPLRDPRGRAVSIAHVGWLRGLTGLSAGSDATRVEWVPVSEALRNFPMAFDHAEILSDAAQSVGLV